MPVLLNRTCQGVDKHHLFLEGYSCLGRLSEDLGGSQEAKIRVKFGTISVSKIWHRLWLGSKCSVQGVFASTAWRSTKSCSHIRALSPLSLPFQSIAGLWFFSSRDQPGQAAKVSGNKRAVAEKRFAGEKAKGVQTWQLCRAHSCFPARSARLGRKKKRLEQLSYRLPRHACKPAVLNLFLSVNCCASTWKTHAT